MQGVKVILMNIGALFTQARLPVDLFNFARLTSEGS